MKTALALGFLVVCAALSRAQGTDGPSIGVPQVSTTGRGDVRITPDRAVLSAIVDTRNNLANTAASENAKKVAATIAALKAAGASDSQISTIAYSVGQNYDYGPTGRTANGFIARNSLRIEVPKINDIGKLIDAALAGGATEISPVQYLGAKMDDARRQALALAVAQARMDAEALASAAGGTLGALIYLTSGLTNPIQSRDIALYQGFSESMGGTAMGRIAPQDITVTAIATGRWVFCSPTTCK
jgi:uncharacterized protein YggE